MRSNFNQLLLTLVVLDIVLGGSFIMDTYLHLYLAPFWPVVLVIIYAYFWYPMKHIVQLSSTFLTMSIATERYLAVCRYNCHNANSTTTQLNLT